jgi:hypothetical protein
LNDNTLREKKMRHQIASILGSLLLIAAPMASATTIDFQGETVGAYSGGTATITVDGISVGFSSTGLQIRDITSFGFPSGSSRVLSSDGDVQPITLELLGGVTVNDLNFRNWISGVHTGEVDRITASAYDAASNLLGSVTSSNEFITLGFNGIAKVVFDDVNSTGYVLDEIQWRSANGVPEPSSLALLALGALGLGVSRKRVR